MAAILKINAASGLLWIRRNLIMVSWAIAPSLHGVLGPLYSLSLTRNQTLVLGMGRTGRGNFLVQGSQRDNLSSG